MILGNFLLAFVLIDGEPSQSRRGGMPSRCRAVVFFMAVMLLLGSVRGFSAERNPLLDYPLERAVCAVQERYTAISKSFRVPAADNPVNVGPAFPANGYYDGYRAANNVTALTSVADAIIDGALSTQLGNTYILESSFSGKIANGTVPASLVSGQASYQLLCGLVGNSRSQGRYIEALGRCGTVLGFYKNSTTLAQIINNKMYATQVRVQQNPPPGTPDTITLAAVTTMAQSVWGTNAGSDDGATLIQSIVWNPPPNFQEPMSIVSVSDEHTVQGIYYHADVRVSAYVISGQYSTNFYAQARGTGELYLQLYAHEGASAPIAAYAAQGYPNYTVADAVRGGGNFVSRDCFGFNFPQVAAGGADQAFEDVMFSNFRARDRFGWISSTYDSGRIVFNHEFSNQWPDRDPPYDSCSLPIPTAGPAGTGNIPQAITRGLSSADNRTLSFIHTAIDYQLGTSGGCAPCGSATGSDKGITRLRVQRILAPSSGRSGSFGWGGFLDTDLRLTVDGQGVDLFFPLTGRTARFIRDASGYAVVGDMHMARSIRSLTAANAPAPLDTATKVEVEGFDDKILTFELSPAVNGLRYGRLLRQALVSGPATVIAYRWVSADLTGDPTGAGKWWAVQTITGPAGDTATVTTSAVAIGDAYPITAIALPDGKTVGYAYGPWATVGGISLSGLTQVTHPLGGPTTIAGTARADGDLDLLITDPAEIDSGHQTKTVTLSGPAWVDPIAGTPSRWRVRAVRNAAGEYVYRNRRQLSADGLEAWTVVEDHGVPFRLVSDCGGGLVRTDQVSGAVDWATDPATWPWQNIAGYTISAGARLAGMAEPLGRTRSWQISTSTGLTEGSTDAAGNSTVTVRDALGRIQQETDRLGRITKWTRDTAGNPLSVTRAFGTPQAATESWTYNAQGLPLTHTDARGNVTDYAYNAAGQLLTETQPADVAGGTRGVTTRTYDTVGRLTAITDPVSRVTQFAYDARNRLVTTTYADTTTETVTYGTGAAAGRMVAKKDRNGKTTTYGYDAAGRKNLTSITVTRADNTTETLTEACTYVPGTEREASCTRNGETTVYGYDAQGRRTSATVYATKTAALTTMWAYDAADRRISETDPYGRKTFSVYDLLDRVVRTVRESVAGGVPAGTDLTTLPRITTADATYAIEDTVYDAEGQVISRTDARGSVTTFAYDALGRLTSQTAGFGTPAEAITTFLYDAAGNQTQVNSPRAIAEGGVFATVKTYTNRNLVKSVEEASGRAEAGLTAYTYGLDRRVATVTDANAKVTTNTYSPCCGRLTQVQDPLGFLTTYTYDGNGNVLTTVDGNTLTTTMSYDARNRPLKRTDPLGKVWIYTYDDNLLDGAGLDTAAKYATQLAGLGFGRDATTGYGADGSAVAVKDPNGNETVTVYDGVGRVVRTIDGLKKTTTTTYDQPVTDAVTGAALVATVRTDALGATTAQWSDGLGRVRVQVDALGKQTRMTYDAGGNRLSILDADGVGETCTYDALGRKASCSNAGNGAITYQYDAAGNLVRTTDAQGGVEQFAYDARNRKVYQEDRVGAQTRFTFDAVGNLLTITDGQNGVTTYTYDARNLLLTEKFPGTTGGTRTYTYDAGRRLKTRKDQTNLVTTYVYDNANHLTGRQYPDAKNDAFTYDAGGRLLTAGSVRYGTTVTRTYDKANRVLTEQLALGGETWTNTGVYSDTGLLTKLTLPDGTAQDRGYSTRSELTSTKLGGATIATRTYTNGGRLATTVSANGRTESRTYTSAGDGLVEKITIPSVTDFTYTYDSLKRKTAEIDLITPSNTQRFSYDAANRLVLWDRITGTAGPVETQQSWNLSLVGDWTSTTKDGVVENRTHTPVHEVTTVGAATLLYDAKGNLTKDQQAQTFTWDVENRLASAAALVQQSGQTSATYLYDALGRRVRKTVGQNETTWVSWGAQEVYELARNPTAIAADQPPTTPTGGGATPVPGGSTYPSGALLADAAATRVNFQPAASTTPAGWLADTGAVYGVRSGSLSFGWVGAALNQTVDRGWTGWSLYDTFNQPWTTWQTAGSTRATWEIGLANGTYPVVLVCGDAHGIQQRNDFLVEGAAWNDPNPWNGTSPNPTTGQLGKFVSLSGTVTVADGKLTIQPNTTAKAPKICFIEIGAVGTSLDANFTARAASALSTVNARTANGRPDAVKPVITLSLFGTYVDDLLGYRVQKSVGTYATKTSYWTHSNHLYSVAAVTSSTGSVVERYAYNAYGQQTVKNAGGTTIAATAVGQGRGFTGYRGDGETGMYYARARMYFPKNGRFVSRDYNFADGYNLYSAYFIPRYLDPTGWACTTFSKSTELNLGEPKRWRPVPWFTIKTEAKIIASIQGENCDCCDAATGKKGLKQTGTASISGQLSITATAGIDEDIKLGEFKAELWGGLQGIGSATFSGSGSFSRDECSSTGNEANFCVNFTASIGARGGIGLKVQLADWYSMEVGGANAWIKYERPGKACFRCSSAGCSLQSWDWENGSGSWGFEGCALGICGSASWSL